MTSVLLLIELGLLVFTLAALVEQTRLGKRVADRIADWLVR